jgi:N-methylhydantoinase A
MHACELASELGIREVLVPLAPGVTSALGTLYVDIVHDVARSRIVRLDAVDPDAVEALFAELEADATRLLDDDLVAPERQELERALDLRYLGQIKTLTIDVGAGRFDAVGLAAARDAFLAEYGRRYHYATDEIEVELSVVRVRGRGVHDRPSLPPLVPAKETEPPERRQVCFREAKLETPVYRREQLAAGARLDGPLIVEQADATTVAPPGWQVRVDPLGNLLLTDGEGR